MARSNTPNQRLTLEEIPELPGYMSVTQAAKAFGVTKQGMYWRIYDAQMFKAVCRVGGNEEDERPFLLLSINEVEQLLRAEREQTPEQAEAQAKREHAHRVNEWHKRVKAWGRQTGFNDGRIAAQGRPPKALVDAYLSAHPDDSKPA